ncbi:hypothetical protein JCM5353_001293 [Sporobolomyces roseus]
MTIRGSHDDSLHTPSLPNFKLAEKLGQGAFGSVYKALNWSTGETCAVKQIDLSHIPRSELPDIMQEIDLLKNLHHSNIVQYRGYARTDSALYIILEYCENGSLSAIIKKFGRFPESLVGLYTLQVLQGLLYLHDQGVIHRDIKGSNILATKEGSIKLADFGVATRVGGPSDSAVVGSPYWMAPEVVDQSGATTASDIWSLGALVVELLTGKPPYHFLDPMPALFRIVNDDSPPLPEGASAVVRDFLVQCFQKDGNLRIGARKLLRHPWMLVAKKQQEAQSLDRERIEMGRRGTSPHAGSGQRRPISLYDDTVQQVQQWNEALKAAPTTAPQRSPRPSLASLADENSPLNLRRPSAQVASALGRSPVRPISKPTLITPTSALATSTRKAASNEGGSGLPLAHIQPKLRKKSSGLRRKPTSSDWVEKEEEEEAFEIEDDNWDSDFEEGISISKIEAHDRDSTDASNGLSDEVPPSDGEDSDEDSNSTNSLTIRPTPRKPSASVNLAEKSGLETVVEDYSDLVQEGESDPFDGKVRSFKETQSGKAVLRPDESTFSGDTLGTGQAVSPVTSNILSSSPSKEGRTSSPPSIDKYSERDIDDYSDVFGKAVIGSNRALFGMSTSTSTYSFLYCLCIDAGSDSLHLQLSSKSWLGDEDSDEEDPFTSVLDTTTEYDSEEHNIEAILLRDQVARQCTLVTELLDIVSGGNPDDYEAREAALQITVLLEETEEIRDHFNKRHGMLIVSQALQIARSREILSILLRIVNLIVGSDPGELEKLALVGGCPVVLSFASKRYSREIRLEAALFIGSMCRASLLTLQTLISCRGLRTLVDMMDESYNENKDLVWMAVDGISRVFESNGPTPRNDFCRILAQEGLLEPLTSALIGVCGDDDDLAESAKAKIVNILLLFAQSDHKVKEALVTRSNALRIIKAVSLLEPELLALLLKTIKNLSMLPAALDVLQNANCIETLVDVLSREFEGRLAAEIQNHALHTLFNLCRLSKARQEEAASFGAIPILQKIVTTNSPLKQFALPILCDFAHLDSRITRKLLWQHDGVRFYLQLLSKDTYWINASLEAVLAWLQDELARVEDCLLEPQAVESLVQLFCKSKSAVFELMLEPYHKILRTSPRLASRLATQSGFVKRIVERLEHSSKAIVQLNLLRITKTVFDSLSDRRDRDRVVKLLMPAITRVAEEEKTVLASQLAKSLSTEFVALKDSTRRNLASSRRGASEGSTPQAGPPIESRTSFLKPQTTIPTSSSSSSSSSSLSSSSAIPSRRSPALSTFDSPRRNPPPSSR